MSQPGQIGFGTGSLYAGADLSHSLTLVRAAIDAGITWIDTAPLYGHGAAERIVGEAIRGNRDELVLVSKAGILPTKMSIAYKFLGKAAALAGKVPGGRALIPPPAPLRPAFNVFAPEHVIASVENSLMRLGTNRIDYLLLHEIDAATASDEALLNALDKLVAQGKVLAYGTATQIHETCAIAAGPHSGRFSLFQMPVTGEELPAGNVVLHSLLGGTLRRLLDRLKTEEPLREAARGLGIDPDKPNLACRLIAAELQRDGVRAVLFSTSRVARLRELAEARKMSPAEAEAGAQLMAHA